jgi:4-hydroxy-tetrahydrodipicolinate reductase
MSKNVLVMGASGKMGQALAKNMKKYGLVPYLGVGHSKKAKGYLASADDVTLVDLKKINLVVDFSSPQALRKIALLCAQTKTPLVSGTTGLKHRDIQFLKSISKKTAVLWAPNMSVGIAILRKALLVFEQAKEFSFRIEETHHTKKKDSPSGTAIRLKQDLQKIISKNVPIKAFRVGDVIGTHRVFAKSKMEEIELSHIALNRDVFALGALKAGKWILKKKRGFYSMDDVLK